MVARRHWTRHWWDKCARSYRLVTSEGVVAELQEGQYQCQADAVNLIDSLPRLQISDDIADIIDVYLANHLMPKERLGDALHLALASYHKCDFLLT